MDFFLKPFDALSVQELYAILKLRQAVFIVEQACAYLDSDDKDQVGQHLIMKDGEVIAGYARLLPRGVSYDKYCSIGRVVVPLAYRKTGSGKRLMQEAIERTGELWPGEAIKISAQAHLEGFYTSLGFRHTGEAYLEDGIPHIGMVLAD